MLLVHAAVAALVVGCWEIPGGAAAGELLIRDVEVQAALATSLSMRITGLPRPTSAS
jgi:hypothetical protein